MKKEAWYDACEEAAAIIDRQVPEVYRTRTFSGIIGDIKALSPKKARSLFARKKGLGAQYAQLYLTNGIDHGRGYQACASVALGSVLGNKKEEILRGKILDVGCAVGVTAGVLSLSQVTGFDLFPDLLRAAKVIDSLTGMNHAYAAADMTCDWPFACSFDAVVCGLVCHHLKEQTAILSFFSSANRVLRMGGSLLVTLPSGSVSYAWQLENLMTGIGIFGFSPEENLCGMTLSTDFPHSLFWMFTLIFRKTGQPKGSVFIHPGFGFPEYRTPVSRETKGDRARLTAMSERNVRHNNFRFFCIDELKKNCGEKAFVFETVKEIFIRSKRNGREEAAKKMRENNDDILLDQPLPTEFDEKEWRW
jgi:SAM-dependent methyltransferase